MPESSTSTAASGSRTTPPPSHDFGEGPSAPPRKWDDPPPDDPPAPSHKLMLPTPSTLLVENTRFTVRAGHEIIQLGFTGSDSHILCSVPPQSNHAPQLRTDGTADVLVYEMPSLQGQKMKPRTRGFGLRTIGAFHLPPVPASATVLVGYGRFEKRQYNVDAMAVVEGHDLLSEYRVAREEIDVCAPLAGRASMTLVVGTSVRDRTRLVVLTRPSLGNNSKWTIARVIAVHMARVTHVALMPDETVVVSADEDGWVRMTDVGNGSTLRKVQIDTKVPARLMQISGDGSVVVTVWGRQVLVWKVNEEDVSTFNLDDVRPTESWPLAISADCRLLVSRTEDGIEVVDAQTGDFRADYQLPPQAVLVTTAAFNHHGDRLALGDFGGEVRLLEVVIAQG